jgi:tetratricopeptide (TPR) repeat protein
MVLNAVEQMIPEDVLLGLISIGHAARKAGWVNESERMFEHLCHAYPLRAFPYVGMALACIEKGRHAQACVMFEQAMQLGEKSQDVYLWSGICHYRCGRYAEAAKFFQELESDRLEGTSKEIKKVADIFLADPRISRFSSNKKFSTDGA